MSMNEKSFLLYGEKKLIAREQRKLETILAFNGLSSPDFGACDTPEPLTTTPCPPSTLILLLNL
jgi:hypothetical protein